MTSKGGIRHLGKRSVTKIGGCNPVVTRERSAGQMRFALVLSDKSQPPDLPPIHLEFNFSGHHNALHD